MTIRRQLVDCGERFSARRRRARGELFTRLLQPTADDLILDLGGGDGTHFTAISPLRANVVVADIDPAGVDRARERYGFQSAWIEEGRPLPFPDGHFDIVFCSSVIEHATVPKDELDGYTSRRAFAAAAWERQRAFAAEIRRVGKRYFVQTPDKRYPLESHTWFPAPFLLLPRTAQLRVVRATNGWWPKPALLDWHLLDAGQVAALFPGAEIVRERTLGVTKSLIAVKR